MKLAHNISKSFKNLHVPTTARLDEKIFSEIAKASMETETIKPASAGQNVWRIIMKTKITKLAAAAVIIIGVLLSITIFDVGVKPAYAIEQTIEAFMNVRFLHTMRHDESGKLEDERWIEIGPDGIQARYRQDTPSKLLVVDNLENIFVYRKDKNAVILYGPDGQKYSWIHDLHKFFKDMAGDSALTIEENVDYNGQKAHLVRWLTLNVDCYINPETKLPIALGPDEIYYEEPPEGIFDIPPIPEVPTFVDMRTDAQDTGKPSWMANEQTAQLKFDEARKALATGEYQKAVELFKKVFELEGTGRNWAWFWLGQAHYDLGQYDAAIKAFTQVIDMFAKHNIVSHYSYLARGHAYRAIGDEEAAWEDFEVALPVMIDSLRNIQGAGKFNCADDPLHRGGGVPSEENLPRMIERLREVTGQNFGYDSQGTAEDNEQAISAWEDWWQEYIAE